MKKLISLFFLLISCSLFYAQSQELPKFGEMAKNGSIISIIHSLKDYSDTANKDFIDTHDLESKTDAWYDEHIAFSAVAKRHKSNIIKLYRSIGYVEDVAAIMNYINPDFAVNSSQDTCIFVGAYSYCVNFNTLRTDEISRAKNTCKYALLPIIQKMAPTLKEISYPYVMIGGAYGFKDFSDYMSASGGCVFCLFKLSDLIEYSDLELTQEELLQKANIYLREGTNEMKRVSF